MTYRSISASDANSSGAAAIRKSLREQATDIDNRKPCSYFALECDIE
jgi:hypothetical protein